LGELLIQCIHRPSCFLPVRQRSVSAGRYTLSDSHYCAS